LTKVVPLDQILKALPNIDILGEIERGFVALSEGKVEVPPVGEMLFPEENGEFHIKYGAVRGDDVFVVKLATGFFNNPKLGLPPFSGCMLVLCAKTGRLLFILLEEGELTNHRTAAAGAVVARYLAPHRLQVIGICGSRHIGAPAGRLSASRHTVPHPCFVGARRRTGSTGRA
jgi:ornithine cyclodeaminase